MLFSSFLQEQCTLGGQILTKTSSPEGLSSAKERHSGYSKDGHLDVSLLCGCSSKVE